MAFGSMAEIIEKCESEKIEFWKAVMLEDISERDTTEEESREKMVSLWHAMLESSEGYDPSLKSNSGLVGGQGKKMGDYVEKGDSYCGEFVGHVIRRALEMGESNACMRRIVAAPTAGACGVMPSVLVTLFRERMVDEEKIINALYVSAGIGQVIAARAFIAGAAGGCQAEIGAASAMAAGALAYIKGGSGREISAAAGMALQNLMGLVCDPVAGLVEVPCVKRNVVGAVNALSCADMAAAGLKSAIPTDEIIDAMREVGEALPPSLKETGKGGAANTPTGRKIREELMGEG
jgi:L-serine dehydratase